MLLKDFQGCYQGHLDVLDRGNTIVCLLNDEGNSELADKLAIQLFDFDKLSDPATFKLQIYTGFGSEHWAIRGRGRMQDVWDGTERSASNTENSVSPQACAPSAVEVMCGGQRTEGRRDWEASSLLPSLGPLTLRWIMPTSRSGGKQHYTKP